MFNSAKPSRKLGTNSIPNYQHLFAISIGINRISYCLGIKKVEGPSCCDIKDVEYGDYDMGDDEFGKHEDFPGLPYFVLGDVDDDSKQQWIEVPGVVY